MPLLVPVLVGLLLFLVSLGLGELSSELFAESGDVFVSLDVIPPDAFVEFPVADWAEVARMSVGLLEVVGALLEALVPGAVSKAEHVSQLVGGDLANSHEHGIFFLLLGLVLLVSKLFGESMDTLDSTERWDSVSEAVIAEALGEEIDISEGEDSNCIRLGLLDWANDLVEDANGIVLLLSMAVGLSSKESQRNSIEDVLGDIWKDFNFARLELGLEPLLQVSFQGLS